MIGSLASAAQPWPAELREEVAARVRATVAQGAQSGAPRAPVLAAAAREIGRDLLAIAAAS